MTNARYEPAMRRALALAAQAAGRGDVPVGAVVLGPDGGTIGEGANERELAGDPTAHAEVLALRKAESPVRRAAADALDRLGRREPGR